MFQCYYLNSSHPLLPPLFPQVCSLCLHLHCYPESSYLHFSKLKFFFKNDFCLSLLLIWMIFFCPCIPGDEIKFIFKGRTRKIKHKILSILPPPTERCLYYTLTGVPQRWESLIHHKYHSSDASNISP